MWDLELGYGDWGTGSGVWGTGFGVRLDALGFFFKLVGNSL